MVVVLAHWVEHAVQAYLLGWSVPDARGGLGMLWPWLVTSETLHYGYALFMLVGLVLLRDRFSGTARQWWTVALVLQVWHHLELLLSQAVAGHPFFGAAQNTSLVQLIFPRVELHLFYNAVVFTPMLIAIYLQSRPARPEAAAQAA